MYSIIWCGFSACLQSICPRSFLFLIIQGINLVYSPQEPVTVALDLPSKSLDTQSVGTEQQLGLSQSCQPNKRAGRILAGVAAYMWCIWQSVTLASSGSFYLFVCLFNSHIYSQEASLSKVSSLESAVFKENSNPSHSAKRSEERSAWFIMYPRTNKWWIVARCSKPIYSW